MKRRKCEDLIYKIESHYRKHGANIEVYDYERGEDDDPVIFEIRLKKGTRERLIFDRASDIQTALGLELFQPFKEDNEIFIAVSEETVFKNDLSEIYRSTEFQYSEFRLPIIIGYNVRGEEIIVDLAKIPHILVAGASNSGKSVFLTILIFCLILKQSADRVNFILVDISTDDLDVFEGVQHLSCPVIKDYGALIPALKALVAEVTRRNNLDISERRKLPTIVLVIDEYISLIDGIDDARQKKVIKSSIANLLRLGRHANVHVILATQDPTVKNTGIDLGCITTRVAFQCAKPHDSVAILGVGGAEKLPGRGAMLFKSPPDYREPMYVQGAYIHPETIRRNIPNINSRVSVMRCENKFIIGTDKPSQMINTLSPDKPVSQKELANVIMWVLGRDKTSALQVQKYFRIGNRVTDIMDVLYEAGIIADQFAKLPRDVLPRSIEDIPEEIVNILLNNGFTVEDISNAFHNREGGETL